MLESQSHPVASVTPPQPVAATSARRDWRPILAALLFILILAPFALTYVAHHPDERHYTNGAIHMLQSGDYLTPRLPDGTPRFLKPVLTYWAVAASYLAFGVSQATSRLPFLLVGAAIVLLTHRLALLVFERRRTALLAAWIAASHPLLILSASYSMPDVLLTLFLSVSAYGLMAILLSDRRAPALCYWAAYGGAGLAVATKGLPALVFLGLSLALAVLNPWRRVRSRDLVHAPSLLAGTAVGLGWFIAMALLHGELALGSFFADQVGDRVSPDPLKIAWQILLALMLMGALFLPWNLGAARGLARVPPTPARVGAPMTVAVVFVLVWALAMALMAGPVATLYPRYLLPAIPLLAVLMAFGLDQLDEAEAHRFLRRALVVVWALVFALLLLALGMGVALGLDAVTVVGVLAAGVGGTLLLHRRRRATTRTLMAAVGTGVLTLFFAAFLLLRPTVLPDQGTQIAAELRTLGLTAGATVVYYGHPKVAAKIRVAAGPGLHLAERPDAAPPTGTEAALVIDGRLLDTLPLAGYRLVEASRTWGSLPLGALWAAYRSGGMAAFRARHQELFVIALPPRS